MKMLRRVLALYVLAGVAACGFTACDDDGTTVAVPVAPILKEVTLPGEKDVVPGGEIKISGLGFSNDDTVILIDESGREESIPVSEVTDYHIKVIIPVEAGGDYTIAIERAGKRTVLNGTLRVPLIVPLTDVVMPSGAVARGGKISIQGKGFAQGDKAVMYSDFYPAGVEFRAALTLTPEGVEFAVPDNTYGVNSVIIERGDRKSNIGTITVATEVGDKIGGGVVYWVDANKAHGFIVNMTNIGSGVDKFGPERDLSDKVAFGSDMGTGKDNTDKYIAKYESLIAANGWPEWVGVKCAAQIARENSATAPEGTYTDWFLPSRQELIEVFKLKKFLIEKGVSIAPNNYWTSTEDQGWSAFYVNFYEDTNLISEICSKSSWAIGVLPVRSY